MVEGGAKCIKYLMFFFNFIFFLCGLGIIIGGALVFTIYNDYVDFTGDSGNAVPIILIVVGSFIFITGFIGCCGALKDNYCMMATFAGIMVILLVIEIGVGIAGYVLRDEISDTIQDNMYELMSEDYLSQNATMKLFDDMHQDLKCCGTNNYTDWFEPFYADTECEPDNNCVPQSCCMKEISNCEYANVPTNPTTIYTKGCDEALTDLITDNIAIIAAVAIVVAVVEMCNARGLCRFIVSPELMFLEALTSPKFCPNIFGIICACCLIKAIKSDYEVV